MKKSRKVIRWKTISTIWRRMNITTKERSMTFETLFAAMKAPRWIAALVSLAITMPALAECPLSFPAAASFAVSNGPFSVAVGDFNADGRPGLAVANLGSNNVSILLGNLSGTFQAPVNDAVGTRPYSVAVGDFNADGFVNADDFDSFVAAFETGC